MSELYFKDGTPIPQDQVAEAIKGGTAFADKSKPVHMLDDTGSPVVVNPEDYGQAVSAGFQLEDPSAVAERQIRKERSTIGQQAISAAEGAARGATLGLSDVAATKVLGDDYRKAADERRKVNPLTAGGSEIVGAVAPALLSGGETAIASGARLTPAALTARAGNAVERGVMAGARALGYTGESTIARMGARAAALGAQGAVEGAAYGAGKAVSDAALEGTDLTAEKVLSGMGHGALFGGATGAAFGAAGGLASGAARKLLGSTSVKERARQLADESALKAAGFQGSDFKKIVGRRTGQEADDRIAEVGQELLNYQFKSGPLKGKKLFSGAKKAEDLTDDISFATQEIGSEIGAIRRKVDELSIANPELAPDLNSFIQRVDADVIAPLRESNIPAIRAKASRVEEQLGELAERHGSGESFTFAELEKTRRDLREVFQPPKPSSGGMPAAVPEHAAALERAERILDDELDSSVKKAFESMGDAATAQKYQELQKQYGAFRALEDVSTKAAKQQLGNRALSPSDYATGMGMYLGMLMSGNVGALAPALAGTIAHKFMRERGRSVLAQVADRVAKVDFDLGAGVQALAGLSAASRRAVQIGELNDRYEKASKAVQQFQSDPQYATAALAAPVRELATQHPQLAMAVQAKLQGDYQYLATKLPTPLSRASASLTPNAVTTKVLRTDKTKFMGIVDALENPAGVVEDLAHGDVPKEKIEALKVRRPEIYSQIRRLVIQTVSTRETELPFLQRMRLSLAFDFTGDKSLDPATLQELQSENQIPANDEGKPGPKANINPDVTDDLELPSQKALGA